MKAPVKILAGLVVAFGVSSATFALAGERGEPSVIRLQQGFSGVCEACDLRERDFSNAHLSGGRFPNSFFQCSVLQKLSCMLQ